MPITAERMIRLIDAADSAVTTAFKLREDFIALIRAQRGPGGQFEQVSSIIARMPREYTENPDFIQMVHELTEAHQVLVDRAMETFSKLSPELVAVIAEERTRMKMNAGRHKAARDAQARFRMRRQIEEFGEVQLDRRRRVDPEAEPSAFESDIAKRYAAYKSGKALEDQAAAEALVAAPQPAAELSDEEADEQYAKFKREQRERLAESERRIAERNAAIARGETVNFITAPKAED